MNAMKYIGYRNHRQWNQVLDLIYSIMKKQRKHTK